jgi:hypothetical protein
VAHTGVIAKASERHQCLGRPTLGILGNFSKAGIALCNYIGSVCSERWDSEFLSCFVDPIDLGVGQIAVAPLRYIDCTFTRFLDERRDSA